MAIQFPADPIANPTYEYEGVLYVWDTDRWIVDSTGSAGADLQQVCDVGSATTTGATFGGTVNTAVDVENVFGVDGGHIRIFGGFVAPSTGTGGLHLSYDNVSKQSLITAGSPNAQPSSLAFAFPFGGQDPNNNIKATITRDGKIVANAGYALAQLPTLP